MKRDDIPMYDDPNESAFVRELLHAGRRANSDYNVERGLARHIAQVAATASLPAVAAAAAKSSFPAWLGYVALPLAAASVAGVLWMFSTTPTLPVAAPATTPAGAPAQPVDALDTLEPNTTQEPEGSDARDPARHRRGARYTNRPSPAAHATPRSQRVPGNSRATLEPAAPSAAPTQVGTESANSQDMVLPSGNPYVSDSTASASSAARPDPEAASAEPQADEETATEASERKPAAKTGAAPAPVLDESRLEREMQMLAVTQRVLAADPQRALRLAQQGEREFPGTMFSAERRQLGLLALVKLGRLDEARRAGRPFLARYPNAPWSERLRRALSTGHVE